MPSVQIKNVPPEVHRILRRRAAEGGKSLQEYLLARLIDEANQSTVEEVMQRVSQRSGGVVTFEESVHSLRNDRDTR